MGLLDDAIREHLELKRRRGADPGEVAREQREALEPIARDPAAAEDDKTPPAEDQVSGDAGEQGDPTAGSSGLDAPDQTEAVHDADLSNGGETAELDMRSVLGGDEDEQASKLVEEESLEWEVPAETSGAVGGSDPVDGGVIDEQHQSAEDVLEETPDFLRDTPEQERLWFEQRPPRDFDFDK